MWNAKTKQLVADGKLVVLGVVQEQHAERAKLYKQWKQYDFPIVQDAFTEIGMKVVPVPILVDEYGFVQSSRPSIRGIEALVSQKADKPDSPASKMHRDQRHDELTKESSNGEASERVQAELAVLSSDALLQSGKAKPDSGQSEQMKVDRYANSKKAITGYVKAEKYHAKNSRKESLGALYFRMGVAHRMVYDYASDAKKDPEDFNKAAHYWSKALELNPNQYIWRRRIQQYGPRQIKPYPFYDWVDQATKEITARGETPIKLKVPLTESEIAKPSRKFETATNANPDPKAEITLDDENLVNFHATVVPAIIKPGQTVRVHLRFAPKAGKWNNESSEMVAWVNESEFGKTNKTLITFPNASEETSGETRNLEFEFATSKSAQPNSDGVIELSGYALFNACKSDDGQCLYRRKEFKIPISVK